MGCVVADLHLGHDRPVKSRKSAMGVTTGPRSRAASSPSTGSTTSESMHRSRCSISPARAGSTSPLRSGQPAVIREAFSITDYWDDIRNFDANATVSARPAGPHVDAAARTSQTTPTIRSSRSPSCRSSPTSTTSARRFDVDIHTCYNMTEINCPVIQQHPITNANHRSCGQVRPGVEVRVVDEFDQIVPPDTPGEMIMRTEPWEINTGYWNMADKTNEAWRNGWFHTGDAFTYDDDGNFFFVDRAKDYIRRRGENISSFEVEALVNEYPGSHRVRCMRGTR